MSDIVLDKTKQGIAAFIRSLMTRVDFMAMYPCTVASTNGDGTLELQPDDPRLPQGLSHVPLRLGLPGTTVTLQNGTRVLVGWYGGNPSKPFAALFESSTVSQMTVQSANVSISASSNVSITGTAGVTFNSGAIPVAKEGSGVIGTAGPYPLTGAAVQPLTGSQLIKVP